MRLAIITNFKVDIKNLKNTDKQKLSAQVQKITNENYNTC